MAVVTENVDLTDQPNTGLNTVVGRSQRFGSADDRLEGERIVDVDPPRLPMASPYTNAHTPGMVRCVQATFRSRSCSQPAETGEELKAAVIELMGSANMADRSWITSKPMARWVAALARCPNDSGVLRVDEETGMGIGLPSCNSVCVLDPYAGSQLAVAESYRNVATQPRWVFRV